MEERWKDIEGFELSHQISDKGRVRVKERKINNNGTLVIVKEHIIRPYITNIGYVQYNLYFNGKCTKRYAHRLVAKAFIPNPDNLEEVDHIDNCKTNNNVNNLQWISHRENMRKQKINRPIKQPKKQVCQECGTEITRKAKRCPSCERTRRYPNREKIPLWSKDEMLQEITALKGNFSALGRKYGVSDNAMRKRFKANGLPHKSSDYKTAV